VGRPKSLIERYRQLNLWSRITIWGSIASIIGFAAYLVFPQSAGNHRTVTIKGSPGTTILQSGRDIIINKETSDKRLVQSLVIEVRINQQTSPKTPSGPETSLGLQSVVALFTTAGQRIRFVTDYHIVDQQLTAATRQLTLVYSPETPSEVLGKEIGFLGQIEELVVNYAEIFRIIGFAGGGEPTSLDLLVRLNGVEVVNNRGGIDRSGVLARGQARLNVAPLFQRVPDVYDQAVSPKSR
jgi:hypothetical protein